MTQAANVLFIYLFIYLYIIFPLKIETSRFLGVFKLGNQDSPGKHQTVGRYENIMAQYWFYYWFPLPWLCDCPQLPSNEV